jgi:lysophospholipase L1-like esterase
VKLLIVPLIIFCAYKSFIAYADVDTGFVTGDSFSNNSSDWPFLLASISMHSTAVSGQKLVEMADTFELQLSQHISDYGIDIAIIQGGINDISSDSVSLTMMEDAINEMAAIAKSYNMPLIIVNVAPWTNAPSESAQNEIIMYNSALDEGYQNIVDLIVVDIYSLLSDPEASQNINPLYSNDGIHPNAEGHRLIAQAVEQAAFSFGGNELFQRWMNNDFDRDADSDVLLRNTVGGGWRLFSMENGVSADNHNPMLWTSTAWKFQAAGDFDGDGDADILVRNPEAGGWRLFVMENGVSVENHNPMLWTSTAWEFQVAGDFDGDGDMDILMRKPEGGGWRLFNMENGVSIGNQNPALWTSAAWKFQAAGDLDGDGDDDILMRDPVVGGWQLFNMESGVSLGNHNPTLWTSAAWEFQATGDFDGDGDDDILIRNPTAGGWRLFIMESGVSVSNHNPTLWTSTAWKFQAAGDFDGDGDADILIRNPEAGGWRLLSMEDGVSDGNHNPKLWTSISFDLQ